MSGLTAWKQDLLKREAEACGADPIEIARQLAAALEARGDSQFLQTSAEAVGAGESVEMPPDVAVCPWPVWNAVKAGLLVLARDNARLKDALTASQADRDIMRGVVSGHQATERRYHTHCVRLMWLAGLLMLPYVVGLTLWIAGEIAG